MNQLAERRQEEKERRRSEILDAAEAVAAEAGIDSMTMDEVARKARLSRALLYVYFQDRSDLLLAICERALLNLHGRFKAAAREHASGREQIGAIGRAFVTFSREQPVHYDALTKFAMRSSAGLGDHPNELACLQHGDRVHEVLVASIGQGMRDGSIRATPARPRGAHLVGLHARHHPARDHQGRGHRTPWFQRRAAHRRGAAPRDARPRPALRPAG